MTNNSIISTDDFTGSVDLKALNPVELANISRSGDYGNYIDIWKTKRTPDDYELVKEYKRIAYACSNLNSNAVSQIPIRLYVKTGKSDKKAHCRTRKLATRQIDNLQRSPYLSKQTRDLIDVEEVLEHRALDLLDTVNDFPGCTGNWLRVVSQLYQEIVGRAYWYVVDDIFGVPIQLWIIPSQHLTPFREQNSTRLIDYYKFAANTPSEKKYTVDEIIPFLMPNLKNPYVDGLSPLMAAFESNSVSNKLIAHEDSFLSNEARPDAIITPTKDNPLDKAEARRIELSINKKFSRGNTGRAWVSEEELQFTPINYPPRDLARLEIHMWSKSEIANAYDTPLALLEGENINRATLEAAREQHALNCVKPRLERYVSNLNEDFLPRFDPSGRLFFAYDNPVPEIEEIKLQKWAQLVMNGIATPNEAREDYKLPELPGGDKLVPINVSPDIMRQNERDSGSAKQ